ncbi:P-loop containing nucleoside triphosphate hydrolase protein [Hypomontagnella monticulosa]|nr:P-loop containing nucleoside triphosphate hydrolase protein [Hypomontagnella monticulosa]
MGILEEENGVTPPNEVPKPEEEQVTNVVHTNGVTSDKQDQPPSLKATLSVGDQNKQPGDLIFSAESLIKPFVVSLVQAALQEEKTKNQPKPETPPDSKDEQSKQSSSSIKRSRKAWKAMGFPVGLEEVFTHEINPSDDKSKIWEFGGDFPWGAPTLDVLGQGDDIGDSPARSEWLRQKKEDNEENPYLDQLMSMVGREEVKAHFLAIKSKVKGKDGKRSPDFEKLRLHLVLQGRHGTGKSSIASLYAEFLHSLGIGNERVFFTRGPISIIDPLHDFDGDTISSALPPRWRQSSTTEDTLENDQCPEKAMVIFHDNSDVLSDSRRIDNILEKAEERPEKIILILSSINKSLLDNITGSEYGIRQLQGPLVLDDYTDDELLKILIRIIKKKGYEIEGGFDDPSLRVLVQRVTRKKPDKFYRNVYTLKEELNIVYRRRALRLQREYTQWLRGPRDVESDVNDTEVKATEDSKPKPEILTREDIIGPMPKDIREENKSWKKLQAMVGLEKIKAEIGNLIDYVQTNYDRQLQGKEPIKANLNRLFLGPPGVGKTTVARLYGQMIADLGLVSQRKVIVKNPTDLIGAYTGHSETNTRKILDEAKGKVLIIDDAHMLYQGSGHGTSESDTFRVGVIDTLVTNISADPGEDRCVILVGYEQQMQEMFRNSNPGLQRRFPMESALNFEEHSEDQLCKILELKLAKDGSKMTGEARKVSRLVLRRMMVSPKFGNGGDVENLLSQAKIRHKTRTKSSLSRAVENIEVVLGPADFDPDYDRASNADESRKSLFDGFVGFEKIIDQFKGYQQLAAGMRRHDIDPKPHIPWAFIFKGPPGTGKTSTARKVGRLYYDMGLLSTDEVVTCSVTDIIGEYTGQTGPKVVSVLESGLGKVLFIDEAYRLADSSKGSGGGSNDFHREAVGELVDAMTKPRYAGNMIVILAGYTEEMEHLMRTNQGLRSRFPTQISFPHMDPQSCYTHLKQMIRKLKVGIKEMEELGGEGEKPDLQLVHQFFARLSSTKGWANGRDVETLAKTIIGIVYRREGQLDNGAIGSLDISMSELMDVLQNMLLERGGYSIGL